MLSSYRQKLKEKTKTSSRKPSHNMCSRACTIFAVLSILLFFCGSAGADYFPPAPPPSNIVKETFVSVALTTPATTVYINMTEYDAQQMVKNITIEFREPVTYLSLVIDVLKDKPLVVNAPSTVVVIQYYAIRFVTELTDKITNVTIVVAIEKAAIQGRNVEESAVFHYQYDGSKFEICPTQKVDEDDTFLYFKTETKVSPYFAIAGAAVSTPWWSALMIITLITLFIIIGIYIYRRFTYKRLRNPVRT